MGFLSKITRSTPKMITSANANPDASLATAETELARNTSFTNKDPFLVKQKRSLADSSSDESRAQEEHVERAAETRDEPTQIEVGQPESAELPVTSEPSHNDLELGDNVKTIKFEKNPSDTLHQSTHTEDSSVDSEYIQMQRGPLPNPEALVMGQLIQWKFGAEEGSLWLRVPALLAALANMVTTLLVLDMATFTVGHVIISIYVFLLALVICITEGRMQFARDPLGSRAKLRNIVMRHVNVLKLVYGRGFLYIVCGLLNMAHEMFFCYIAGGILVLLGVIGIAIGLRASKTLGILRRSLSDQAFLRLEFIRHDKDRDGNLDPSEFAQFIWDLGLEFDDLYTLKAFTTIDTDQDKLVNFREFVRWWSQVRLNGQ